MGVKRSCVPVELDSDIAADEGPHSKGLRPLTPLLMGVVTLTTWSWWSPGSV
jgi:hypothetical protein